jgi:hypothetical protein
MMADYSMSGFGVNQILFTAFLNGFLSALRELRG